MAATDFATQILTIDGQSLEIPAGMSAVVPVLAQTAPTFAVMAADFRIMCEYFRTHTIPAEFDPALLNVAVDAGYDAFAAELAAEIAKKLDGKTTEEMREILAIPNSELVTADMFDDRVNSFRRNLILCPLPRLNTR
jgi:hypothetical protein